MLINKRFLLVVLLALTLGGCATPARIDKMVVSLDEIRGTPVNEQLKKKVIVNNVTGGESTNPLWTSEIGNSEFKQALIGSLKKVGLLSNNSTGEYTLNAKLAEVNQPMFGASFTVTVTVVYNLTDKNNNTIFKKTISTPFTATMSDALLGMERLKIANEGAARTNIKSLIKKLNRLDVKVGQLSLD